MSYYAINSELAKKPAMKSNHCKYVFLLICSHDHFTISFPPVEIVVLH